jgi:hypothetical protein
VDTLKSQTAALQTDLAANKAEDDKTMRHGQQGCR